MPIYKFYFLNSSESYFGKAPNIAQLNVHDIQKTGSIYETRKGILKVLPYTKSFITHFHHQNVAYKKYVRFTVSGVVEYLKSRQKSPKDVP